MAGTFAASQAGATGRGTWQVAAGFSSASFEESDGSEGGFFGTFVGLSEDFGTPGE